MIPDELKSYPQWVCAAANKIPLDPKTGEVASVTDPSTWSTYQQAVEAGYPHVGFVLTQGDPYTFIDLDEPTSEAQRKNHTFIFETFQTYSELSQSGRGIHIICRGTVPHGIRQHKVEVYSDGRYMICTGRPLRDLPITDCQDLLHKLYADMNRHHVDSNGMEEVESTISDVEVILKATRATNHEKFEQLFKGEWQGTYQSQSEADFALLSMLCFYTRGNEQVRRLFRNSELGTRAKAQRDAYLNTAIAKIRAAEPPPIDFKLRIASPEKQEAPAPAPLEYPPGFVGALARYITETSLRPVAEVGITAALALVAGVCGRQFNINGTGLNLYIILLAKTGVGKEGGPQGIERVMSHTRPFFPSASQFIGPAHFASGQSIIRRLDTQPCQLAILGEFGLTLQDLTDEHANGQSRMMRKVLLDLYGKSGKGAMMRSSVYSDVEKNTKEVESPALTILGESTPEAFYSGISLSNIAEGLIPRFLVVEYMGDRPPRNHSPLTPPYPALIEQMVRIVTHATAAQTGNSFVDVNYTAEAWGLLNNFDDICDAKVRGAGVEAIRQLWNRAHLKALRVSALLAVGDNPGGPVIQPQHASWAIDLVSRDVSLLVDRFRDGDVGEGDAKQVADLRRAINEFVERPFSEIKNYQVNKKMYEKAVIPYGYLWRRLSQSSSFKKDRRGAKTALRSAIDVLIFSGLLRELTQQDLTQLGAAPQSAYWAPPQQPDE